MRASLLASAIARTLWCKRCAAAAIQGWRPWRAQVAGLSSTTRAAWTKRVRKYLLPRLEILPRMVRSPVEICLGTRPSQAPKSRPSDATRVHCPALAVGAQQPERMRRIGVFMDLAEGDPEGQARVAALK